MTALITRLHWTPQNRLLHHGSTKSRGFTVIELMITIVIAAVVLTLAVPSFVEFIRNSRLVNQANDLVTMLNYARSEAIKRNSRITVCSSSDQATCDGLTTWDSGWIVFSDLNGDGVVDGGDVILKVRQPLEGSNTLRSNSITRVTYRSTGFLAGVFNGTLRLCDPRGIANARSIAVSMQGRVSTSSGAASCP